METFFLCSTTFKRVALSIRAKEPTVNEKKVENGRTKTAMKHKVYCINILEI